MSSFKCDSSLLLLELREDNKKQANILKAIEQYESGQESEDEPNEKAVAHDEMHYQGFENKKSLQIKPVNMFKDAITLRKENIQKKQEVRNLEKINDQLKAEYESAIMHNKKLESFLRQVEFTFQQDHKKAKTSDVILRARRTLFQQAKETRDRLKRMFRNNEASTVQELKVYISTLESERRRLRDMTIAQRDLVLRRMREEDFNKTQISQLESAFERIKACLQQIFEKTSQGRQEYKIEKMEMRRMIKIRKLDGKKVSLKQQSEAVKQLSVQNEGLQYEIQLLRHRLKDRKKEFSEYEQLKDHIQQKHSTIIRLQKELREKNKTFDYMLEWTKQLKKQLEERKLDHARKKAEYEEQINSLSEKYQRYNQIYKTGLFEQQVARRKGPKDPQPQTLVKTSSKGRQVTMLEIKQVIKSLSFQLFKNQANTDKFIQGLLKITIPQTQKQVGKRIKLKTSMSIDPFGKDIITVGQLADNIKATGYDIPLQMIIKISRFVVEDGSGKAEQQAGISTLVAKQVLKKLLEREMESAIDISETTKELRKLEGSQIEGIRHQLKIAGGKEEQISIDILRQIFFRYGISSYYANLFSEFMEFYGWSKRMVAGSIRLQDFDWIFSKIKYEDDMCFLSLIS